MKNTHDYGHAPSNIPARKVALGWLKSVHRFLSHRGATTCWHAHAEVQLLCSLFGEFKYEFRDRPPVMLSTGQCIVIPANTPHRLVKMQEAAGKRVELLLSVPRKNGGAGASGIVPAPVVRSLLAAMSANPCRAVQCRREYLALFAEMFELADRGGSLSGEEIALVRVLASMILLKYPGQDARRRREPLHAYATRAEVADKLIEFIEAHYKENLSIARLSAYGGYSRATTIGMVQDVTGKSPNQLITHMRMAEAVRLLSGTGRAVSDIALECGYSSVRYFNYAFKKAYCVTPTAWRIRNR